MKGLILVYGMTYGGAAVALFNPFYGLCIYIAFAILKPEILWPWSVQPGNYSRIIGVALLIGWALNGFGNWKLGRGSWGLASLACFWGWSLLSATSAEFQEVAWNYMDNLTKIVLPILVGATVINSLKQLQILAWTIALSVGYLAFRENESYLTWGLAVGDNITAHTMAAGAGILFFVGIQSPSWWKKLLGFGGAALASHTVLFHMSRGAMMGLVVTAISTFFVVPKTPKFLALILIALAVGIRMAGPAVVKEFQTTFADEETRDESAQSRLVFWRAMGQATMEHPLTGVGPRNWPPISWRYGINGREGHGMWQQLACELGFPGVSFLALFYLSCVWKLLPLAMGRHSPGQEELRPYAQMVVVGLSTWCVEQLVGSFYLVELPYYIGLLGIATLKLSTVSAGTLAPNVVPLSNSQSTSVAY